MQTGGLQLQKPQLLVRTATTGGYWTVTRSTNGKANFAKDAAALRVLKDHVQWSILQQWYLQDLRSAELYAGSGSTSDYKGQTQATTPARSRLNNATFQLLRQFLLRTLELRAKPCVGNVAAQFPKRRCYSTQALTAFSRLSVWHSNQISALSTSDGLRYTRC